ncbi:MAG: restriction endonuclease subunit S [Anaerolineae bacterium]|nr:restriction endonuclease subunit S [Anaerolineae bacterium]
MIDVSPHDLETIKRILAARVPDFEARAYGSRYRWTAKEYSDLDLAIVGERPPTPIEMANLRADFEDSDLPFRVDVLDWQTISPEYRRVIEGGNEVIQKRDQDKRSIAELLENGILYIGDGYRAKNEELGNRGLPFARVSNINNGFHFKDADHFPEENLHRVGEKVSRPSDVVFTSKGTVGRFAFVPPDLPKFVYSPQICFWRVLDPKTIDPKYLYYWMHSREFFLQISGVKSQTDMADFVSLSDQRRMHITLPRIDIQHAIAHILGTLDDKIELNRRMNETLEAIARAIFKSWFVDFDPVRAKAQGRQPVGMDAETAALFPDSFEDSELGEIPRGWRVSRIGDEVRVVGGSTPSTKQSRFWDGEFHWATPKDLASLPTPVLVDTERTITDQGLEQISSGLLPPGTVLLSSRAPIGYLAISEIPISINQGFIAMVCVKELSNHYVLQWTRQNMDNIIGRANGTTFLEISKSNFRPISILVPPMSVLTKFSEQAVALHDKIVNNLHESAAILQMRDALLPKLISGEVQLENTGNFVLNS